MASQVENIKWVPGTDFLVDGFAFKSPRCSHYFLTHFHSDHTVGLNKSFDGGIIYCSHITARLLVHDMGLKPKLVKPLSVGRSVVISGVRVTPLDANHCPGAVMFLFEVPAPTPPAAAAADATAAAAADAATLRSRLRPAGSPLAALPGSLDCDGLAAPLTPAPHAHAPAAAVAWTPTGSPGGTASQQVVAGQGGHEAGRTRMAAGPGGCCGSAEGGGAAGGVQGGAVGRLAAALSGEPSGDPDASEGGGTAAFAAATTHNILHTGDCRWQRWMRDQTGLAGVRVDTLMLDTTYAAPKHVLPPQEEAIRLMVQVWCSPAKRAVLRLLDLPPELTALLVDDPRDAAVHVTGWGLRPEDLQAYLERHSGVWKQAVGIRPTGWTLRRGGGVSVRREGSVCVVGVPYSEHSSWTDLCDAVAQLRPRTLIPTVNAATAAQRRALVDRFAHLMDLSADRSRLDVYLSRGAFPAVPADSQAGGGAAAPVVAPTSSACALSGRGAGPAATAAAAAGTAAAPTTAVRVDLGAVDLAEQERILEDLQRRRKQQQRLGQRQRQRSDKAGQQQPQQPQQRRGKRKSPGDEAEEEEENGAATGAATADKRPRASVCTGGGEGGGGGAAGSAAAAACVIDLSFDDDEDGGGGRVGGSGVGTPCQGQRAQQLSASSAPLVASPSPVCWQSSIRRFFAPIGRVAAAVLGGREGGMCVQEA
ncbi:hypothetical protein PLESTM_001680700 [Pleodorina starrii]|nr:hypothetical protein PLESTM_001680700 [Pleodorina starrii]